MDNCIFDNVFTDEEVQEIKKEMISKVDKELLHYLFKETISYRNRAYDRDYNKNIGDVDDRAVDVYLEIWASAKWKFYLILGRVLNYRFETSVSIDDEFDDKVRSIINISTMKRKVNGEYVDVDVRHFVYYKPIIDLFETHTLVNNICPEDEFFEKVFKIYKPNQKLSRFFSKFFNDENFDICWSKLFQNRVKGLMGNISIDPIDFLLISETNTNWGSCYRLYSFYQGAGYSFMTDKESFICFASRENKEEIQSIGRNWYNKLNRCIMDVREGFGQVSFIGRMCDSIGDFLPIFLDKFTELLKPYYIGELEYLKYVSRVEMVYDRSLNHIHDDPGPSYTLNGEYKYRQTIHSGNTDLPRLTNVDEKIPIYSDLKGWMF